MFWLGTLNPTGVCQCELAIVMRAAEKWYAGERMMTKRKMACVLMFCTISHEWVMCDGAAMRYGSLLYTSMHDGDYYKYIIWEPCGGFESEFGINVHRYHWPLLLWIYKTFLLALQSLTDSVISLPFHIARYIIDIWWISLLNIEEFNECDSRLTPCSNFTERQCSFVVLHVSILIFQVQWKKNDFLINAVSPTIGSELTTEHSHLRMIM